MSDSDIYVKIVDGGVVQYPVLRNHIINSGQPLHLFTICKFDLKPVVPDFYYAKEHFRLCDDYVQVYYTIEPVDVDTLFKKLNETSPLDDIFPSLIERIENLVIERIQIRLDSFAASHKYGDEKSSPMISACSYVNDPNPRFAAEANYCIKLRSDTWAALYQFWNSVFTAFTQGTGQLPTSYAEIEAALPVPQWPEDLPSMF